MSSYQNTLVHKMTGGPVGDVAELASNTQCLKISTRSEGWFRVPVYGELEAYVAPSAPVATPAPAAGAASASGWKYLQAGESWTLPQLEGQSYYRAVEIWEIGTSFVDIDGTNPGWGR